MSDKIPKFTQKDVEEFKEELKEASDLVGRWAKDPAQVLVDYGFGDSPDEFTVDPSGPGGAAQRDPIRVCGKFCNLLIEAELEIDTEEFE